ncbi:MFS transporter [Rivibacter subsaxonicus]|uniref:UMF1 family MFS transporter n=1 Tax=Rivibacter subsaxonicus TaxID=457575 RepID=A0A4Q7VW79_9BURK|nr:MFS transporter [Rivibacter subsaxonicus]RZU00967.1 UMF1 family MFS transporter [Rivibacter subsaxonicus]
MALFPQEALNEGVAKREVFGWAMYDFANSGYTTVVLTAVFSAYFVGVVAGGADWGTLAWTLLMAAANAIVMLSSPALGAHADLHGAKKKLLVFTTIACVLGTAALALVGPGQLALATAAVLVATVAYSYGESLIAAFLPELARPESLGRVSGWGWSFGYFGGMLALGISLAWVLAAQARGETAAQFVPVTMLITAAIYGGASLVTFALLKERAQPQVVAGGAAVGGMTAALQRLAQTWHEARRYRDFSWFLACCVSYQAGIAVVITLAAVYAEQAMGFKQAETMMLIFLVNIAAALGAFAFGYWQDRIGHKPALSFTLAGWVLMVVLAAAARGPALFWVAAVVAGLCMGSSQSAGRALAGTFAPEAQRAEFFGLWGFSVRLAAIIGPLTYGLITWLTAGNHRVAILSTAAFFIVGWVLLQKVDVDRGERSARAAAVAA